MDVPRGSPPEKQEPLNAAKKAADIHFDTAADSGGDAAKRVSNAAKEQELVPDPFEFGLGTSGKSTDISEASDQPPSLLSREAQAGIKDSFNTYAENLVEIIATMHGLGPIYQAAMCAYGVVKWLNDIEGREGIDVDIPCTLGAGVVLETSFHLNGDPDTLPITFSVAPSGASGVGALAIGGLDVDPAALPADWSDASPKHHGPVQVYRWDSSKNLPKALPSAKSVTAARSLAEGDFILIAWRRKKRLFESGVDLIVWYDPAAWLVVWVVLCDARGPRPWSSTDGMF
jgi:hypothetical protein